MKAHDMEKLIKEIGRQLHDMDNLLIEIRRKTPLKYLRLLGVLL